MGEVQKECRHERKREKITRTGLLRVEKDKRVGRSMQSVMVCGCNATHMTVKREKITRTGLLRVEQDKRVGRSMQSVMVCGCELRRTREWGGRCKA